MILADMPRRKEFHMNENPQFNNEKNDMIGDKVDTTNTVSNAQADCTDTSVVEENKKSGNIGSSVFDYFEIFVISIITVLIIFSLFLRIARVDGGSMNQTLQNGESLVISDLFYEPKQGDIVVFHLCQENGYNQPIIKRVIATEGQRVVIDLTAKKTYIDGVELVEEYTYFNTNGYNMSYFNTAYLDQSDDGHWKYVVVVPEGKLFVMGDNRNGSTDSRSKSIGLVDKNTVLGKALFRISPFTIFK